MSKKSKKVYPICLMCGEKCNRITSKFCSFKCVGAYRTKYKIRRGGPVKRKTLKYCFWCDRPFYPINLNKYCSSRCAREINRLDIQEKLHGNLILDPCEEENIIIYLPERKSPKICPWCKKEFKPQSGSTKFCSRYCAGKNNFYTNKNTLFMEHGIESARNMKPGQKAKLAIAMSNRNRKQGYTKGIGGIRQDLGHYVRSRWEANICRLLKYLGIRYLFESDVFKLSNKEDRYIYIPDIKIAEKTYIEVKGWETPKAKIKRELMAEQYPNIEVIYIEEPTYKYLSNKYKDIIPDWEYDKRHGR